MAKSDNPETGWRGSPDIWLEAAYEALIMGGLDAVKIMPLANQLKLARTSFYWHFKDREGLLKALADRWDARTTVPLIASTETYADSLAEALLTVMACFIKPENFDSRLEFAVRSWGLQDPPMMERLRKADVARIGALTALLVKWGHPPQFADVRARTIYLTQIGYISMQVVEPISERMKRVPIYIEIYGGTHPEPREIARFHAQIGYVPED